MSLRAAHTIGDLRACLAEYRARGASIGLVPTMGALHAGHARLIERARRETGCVVVSIFVNPIQFNQPGDYQRYPRTLAADLEFCCLRGADVVFAPDGAEMYPEPQRAFVEVERVSSHLCGRFRPGHFRGVATVVAKLFHIVQPGRAYFGEKDAQQLALIRRMVRDLNVPIEIVSVETVREPDGLALSSRNRRLDPEQRRIAPALYQALQAAAAAIAGGAARSEEARSAARAVLDAHPAVRLEYLEIVDPEEMQPVETIAGPVRVALAAWLGDTRLIDNLLCRPGR